MKKIYLNERTINLLNHMLILQALITSSCDNSAHDFDSQQEVDVEHWSSQSQSIGLDLLSSQSQLIDVEHCSSQESRKQNFYCSYWDENSV